MRYRLHHAFELDLDVLGEYFLTQVCSQRGVECAGGDRIWAVMPIRLVRIPPGMLLNPAATQPPFADGYDVGERGLSSRRVQEHARWYSDAAYWSYSPNALAAGALDAELRAILRKEVFPEHVEIEFERVMKAVPR